MRLRHLIRCVVASWLLRVMLIHNMIAAWDNRLASFKDSPYRDQVFPYLVSDRYVPQQKRNALTVLVHQIDITIIGKLLNNIDTYFQDSKESHLIIFHEQYPSSSIIEAIRNMTSRAIDFANVDFLFRRVPYFKDFNPYSNDPTWQKNGKWNYHNMIRFWLIDVFDHPLLENVEYFMRMDEDSMLQSALVDVFQLMKDRRAYYIANTASLEVGPNILPGIQNLQDFIQDYLKQKQVPVKNIQRWETAFPKDGIPMLYYTNFEVGSVAFFRKPKVVDFISSIIDSGGIYKYRWGDAPIRYLTLTIFATEEQVIQFNELNVRYCHGCSRHSVSSDKYQISEHRYHVMSAHNITHDKFPDIKDYNHHLAKLEFRREIEKCSTSDGSLRQGFHRETFAGCVLCRVKNHFGITYTRNLSDTATMIASQDRKLMSIGSSKSADQPAEWSLNRNSHIQTLEQLSCLNKVMLRYYHRISTLSYTRYLSSRNQQVSKTQNQASGSSTMDAMPHIVEYFLRLVVFKLGVTRIIHTSCRNIAKSWMKHALIIIGTEVPCLEYLGLDRDSSVIQDNKKAFINYRYINFQLNENNRSNSFPRGYELLIAKETNDVNLALEDLEIFCEGDSKYLLLERRNISNSRIYLQSHEVWNPIEIFPEKSTSGIGYWLLYDLERVCSEPRR